MMKTILSIFIASLFAAVGAYSLWLWDKPNVPMVFGADTGYKSPSATGEDYNQWTDATNAYSQNTLFAYPSLGTQQQDYYNFTFGVPSGATINGIDVTTIWISASDGYAAKIALELSWDGGATYTTSGKNATNSNGSTWTTTTFGGSTDTWGRTWSSSDFDNGNFRVKVKENSGTVSSGIDHIKVKVYYTEAAAGTTASVESDIIFFE